MFDTKTMKLIKTIDVGAAQPDGIYFDAFNERVVRLQPPDQGRDGDRRQGRHGARQDRSGRACRSRAWATAKANALRGDAGTRRAVLRPSTSRP